MSTHMTKGMIAALVCLLIAAVVSFIPANYLHSGESVVRITNITVQQNVSGGSEDAGVSTSYRYIVSTDRGIFHISPDGLYASTAFGKIEAGATYRIFHRGYTIPFLGIYPHITHAELLTE